MTTRSVLVVAAGIAGSTLAYWLGRRGIATTVVELAHAQRTSGSPVDVRGRALTAVERMKLLEPLRAAATQVARLVVVDGRGREIGSIPTQRDAHGFEIARRDLAATLASAAREHAEYVYDDTVVAMSDDGGAVDVTFERADPRRFDVVVGADGLHSRVRRLAFGPEQRSITHLGMYIATTDLGRPAADPHTVLLHNEPGRAVAVHPTSGREGAAFIFRHPPLAARAVHDQQQLLTHVYSDMGWRVPELLERFGASDEVYFDGVSRVRLDTWSRGRIGLVGDAASCVSLFGEGSSMAIVGATTLAGALVAHPDEPAAAFRAYEQVHRRRLRGPQRGVWVTSHLLVPATSGGVTARNSALRLGAGIRPERL